jgi:hypothetical protein
MIPKWFFVGGCLLVAIKGANTCAPTGFSGFYDTKQRTTNNKQHMTIDSK